MVEFKENELTYEIYFKLRESVGWLNYSEEQARKAIESTYYMIQFQILS